MDVLEHGFATFNRTKLELKFTNGIVDVVGGGLLIEPYWN